MSSYRSYQQVIRLNPRLTKSSLKQCSPDFEHSHDHPVSASESGSVLSQNDPCHMAKEKKKITRTKTGCFCCRRRKKKCDEHKPACSGCLRNNLKCVYPSEEELSCVSKVKKSKRSLKLVKPSSDAFAASVLTTLKSTSVTTQTPTSPSLSQPDLDSSHSTNSSDAESPVTSPSLKPFQYTFTSPHELSNAKVPYLNINNIHSPNTESRLISVKSLLN